jgi:HEAT repeat protein
VREMCAWALGEMDTKRGTDALLAAATSDHDDSVRETAAWALGEHAEASAAGALGQLLATEKHPGVRGTAAWALGQMELETAPKGLIDAVGDPTTDVRTRAAWALSEIGDAAAIPALRAALAKETDSDARKAEVRALIHSGERSERLTELLESKDPEVRAAAIRGVAGGDEVDPWPWPEPRPRPFP